MSANECFNAVSAKWLPRKPVFSEFEGWLAGDNQFCKLIKHNRKRSVYALLPAPGAPPSYYLKHDHPKEAWDVLRSWVYPKVLREYSTLQLLQNHGVDAVTPVACGWVRGQGVLITEALNDSLAIDELWPKVQGDKIRKEKLLAGLSILLRNMMRSQIYHPDLHFGNILAVEKPEITACALVDVHGVRVIRKLSHRRKMLMIRLFTGMEQNLQLKEVHALLEPLFPEDKPEQIDIIWGKLKQSMVRQIHHKWHGRRRKVLNSNKRSNSICSVAKNSTGTWRWRTGFDLNLAQNLIQIHKNISSESPTKLIKDDKQQRTSLIEVEGKEFITKEFVYSRRWGKDSPGRKRWLSNWRLEMSGLPVSKCLAWLEASDGRSYLLKEYINGISLYESLESAAHDEAKRRFLVGELLNLLARLYFLGFVHKNLNTQKIIINNEEGLKSLYLVGNNDMDYHRRVSRAHWQQHFNQMTETMPDVPALKQDFAQLFTEVRDRWCVAMSR
ncbi:MAG: hypothetical protein JW914_10400 [Syntrophaceae bacterium]|nr:hypothetical protein [Syntrophaceae bacterium]